MSEVEKRRVPWILVASYGVLFLSALVGLLVGGDLVPFEVVP